MISPFNERHTILVVDDSEDDRTLVRAGFKMAACKARLREIRCGKEAIDYLNGEGLYSDRARFPLPALALLDLKMPGTGGFEVLEFVRSRAGLKLIPMVVLSASAQPEDVTRAAELGANTYLIKPTSLAELMTMICHLRDWMEINEIVRLRHSRMPMQMAKGAEAHSASMVADSSS